ncbi:MAG: TIR domain-containing protein [Candidatus Binatia bacterium]
MANIFISYSRHSEAIVKPLVDDIETLGHTVWFDQQLTGGQTWWDQILTKIRDCEVFVFVLDPKALNSVACQDEYSYAAALGKPILPVLVAEGMSTNLLPPALSQIQFVDYRKQDRSDVLRLARALNTVPPLKPLPDPLPPPPDVPISYLGRLAQQIETSATLDYEKQSALVTDLKRSLRDPEIAKDALALLERLRKRRDLFAAIADEINELLESVRKASPVSSVAFEPELLTQEAEKKPPVEVLTSTEQQGVAARDDIKDVAPPPITPPKPQVRWNRHRTLGVIMLVVVVLGFGVYQGLIIMQQKPPSLEHPPITKGGGQFDMVFEGSGAKGMVFVGALKALESDGYTWRRLIGISAGAITATLLAVGYSASQMEEAFGEKDNKGRPVFAQFMDEPEVADAQAEIDNSVVERDSLYLGNAFLQWFRDRLNDQSAGYADLTLAQLYERTGRDLSLVVTDASRHEMLVLNHRTAPHCPITWAVRMSMSIPFA